MKNNERNNSKGKSFQFGKSDSFEDKSSSEKVTSTDGTNLPSNLSVDNGSRKIYPCEKGDEFVTTQVGSLRRHINQIHLNFGSFRCMNPACDYVTGDFHELRDHISTHEIKPPVQCPMCSKKNVFKTNSFEEFKRHVEKEHQGKRRAYKRRYLCPFDASTFLGIHPFFTHVAYHKSSFQNNELN